MKMQKAMDLMNGKPDGFMVNFQWIQGCFVTDDYFPDKHAGEELIKSEHEAWELARYFAEATKGKTVNLYVTKRDFTPIEGYKDKMINKL